MTKKQPQARHYKRGRFERTEPAVVSRLGHPLWDADLNSIGVLKRFKRAKELRWGIVLRVLEPGWEPLEELTVEAVDWRLSFFPPRTIRVHIVRGPLDRSKPRLTSFKHPVALLQIPTEKEDLNRARDYGARLVRSLVGLLQTQYNVIVATQPLWEGAITPGKDGSVRFMASGQEVSVPGLTPEKLRQKGSELMPFRLGALPGHLASSLRWYGLAWASPNDRTAQFMHFWLAALVLINHGTKGEQRKRIAEYVSRMFLSPRRESELRRALLDSYNIRLEIVHECKDDSVSLASLERLEKAALELIEFEKGQFLKQALRTHR